MNLSANLELINLGTDYSGAFPKMHSQISPSAIDNYLLAIAGNPRAFSAEERDLAIAVANCKPAALPALRAHAALLYRRRLAAIALSPALTLVDLGLPPETLAKVQAALVNLQLTHQLTDWLTINRVDDLDHPNVIPLVSSFVFFEAAWWNKNEFSAAYSAGRKALFVGSRVGVRVFLRQLSER